MNNSAFPVNNTGVPSIGMDVILKYSKKSVLGNPLSPGIRGSIVSFTPPYSELGTPQFGTEYVISFMLSDLIAPPRFETAVLMRSDFVCPAPAIQP